MKRIPVRIVPSVLRQIEDQLLFIARHSVANAMARELRLRATIDRIGEVKGYRTDEDLTERVQEKIQVMVLERTYLIRYRIINRGTLVEVVNFRHGARMQDIDKDWPSAGPD